ncbi:hypothetical protein [Ekhidna sp.]
MKNLFVLILSISSINLLGQDAESIAGLWIISKVEVGNEVMTPDAKWTRFNDDSTQESGNGWLQHSYGEWSFDQKLNELLITTSNGIIDPFGAFRVEFDDHSMKWYRDEEGDKVVVSVERTDKLPATTRDQLLGLWKLDDLKGNDDLFKEKVTDSDYLFIRWDGKFVAGTKSGKKYGVYNVHAHKLEIELIPYGGGSRTFWSVEFLEEGFQMTLLDSERVAIRKFKRIKQFPK